MTVWTGEGLYAAWGEWEPIPGGCRGCGSYPEAMRKVCGEMLCDDCAAECGYCLERPAVVSGKNGHGYPHAVCVECFEENWQ